MPNQIARFAALGRAIDGTTNSVKALTAAAQTMGAVVTSAGARAAAQLAETGTVAVQTAEKVAHTMQEWQEQQLGMLERLRQQVIPFEGTDAGSKYSFDKIIEDQIAKVRAGEETAADAIQILQRQFGAVYGTLQNTYFGSQDPSTREFLIALETFINSGVLY